MCYFCEALRIILLKSTIVTTFRAELQMYLCTENRCFLGHKTVKYLSNHSIGQMDKLQPKPCRPYAAQRVWQSEQNSSHLVQSQAYLCIHGESLWKKMESDQLGAGKDLDQLALRFSLRARRKGRCTKRESQKNILFVQTCIKKLFYSVCCFMVDRHVTF